MFHRTALAAALCLAPLTGRADTILHFQGMADFRPFAPGAALASGVTPLAPFAFDLVIAEDAEGQTAAGFGAPLVALDYPAVRARTTILGQPITSAGPDDFTLRIVDSGTPGAPDILSIIAAPSKLAGAAFPDLETFELSLMLDPQFSDGGQQPIDWRAVAIAWPFAAEPVSVSLRAAGGDTAGTYVVNGFSLDVGATAATTP